jgi:hypothetical protein
LIEVLVISGPAAVGKTSVANELSAQLRAADIAHAVIDTDALDDVYPVLGRAVAVDRAEPLRGVAELSRAGHAQAAPDRRLRASRIGAVVDPASLRRRPAVADEAVGI